MINVTEKATKSILPTYDITVYRNDTKPAAKEKHSEVLEQLHNGIKNLLESGDWEKYLKTQAQFHSYSANNCFLIFAQCPDATKIAGYQAWKKLKRQVRKGEKSIKIFAPLRQKVETDDDESKYIIRGFRSVSVFDISQTDGEELPTVINRLDGDDEGLLGSLMGLAKEKDIKVTFEVDVANGFCKFNSNNKPYLININPDLSPKHQAKTMSHELAHAILHNPDEYREHRGDNELEAESTAYVVMSHFGFDTSDYSFGYVASWQKSAGKDLEGTLDQLTGLRQKHRFKKG